jgi:hypothetical protein
MFDLSVSIISLYKKIPLDSKTLKQQGWIYATLRREAKFKSQLKKDPRLITDSAKTELLLVEQLMEKRKEWKGSEISTKFEICWTMCYWALI